MVDVPTTVVDFTILEALNDKGDKLEYLKSRHKAYFDSMYCPEYLLLAISQELDLDQIFPKRDGSTFETTT